MKVVLDTNVLVSGDDDLLVLADQFPILSPTAFVTRFLS